MTPAASLRPSRVKDLVGQLLSRRGALVHADTTAEQLLRVMYPDTDTIQHNTSKKCGFVSHLLTDLDWQSYRELLCRVAASQHWLPGGVSLQQLTPDLTNPQDDDTHESPAAGVPLRDIIITRLSALEDSALIS